MISIDKLVEIGFTVSQATSLALFMRNIGYLTVGTDSVLDDFKSKIPQDKVVVIDTIDTLKSVFKADSQEYTDIATILTQKSNMNPNKSRVNNVIVYFGTLSSGETYGNLVDEMISVNANYAQLTIVSRKADDIKLAGAKALENDRLFVAQTSNEDVANKVNDNIAQAMNKLNNSNVLLMYHGVDTEALACGTASIMANPFLGGVGSLYSTVTSVTPQDYTATVNANLDDQNVSYYTYVNPVNGGGVQQYASPIVYGAKMISGEDAKRRYIRYYLDKTLKARSVDFLKKKLGYEAVSADILESMLKAVLIAGQNNGLIRGDETVDDVLYKGFELSVLSPMETRAINEDAYNSQTYLVNGYYRDSLTGRKVEINLYIDPTETEKDALGF